MTLDLQKGGTPKLNQDTEVKSSAHKNIPFIQQRLSWKPSLRQAVRGNPWFLGSWALNPLEVEESVF